jgi:aspartyl-tRNA(Asn)/glutamyl-tRNA(Gln) amidotransferase subunit B
MRSKEFAHDYRYFPEPDLLPLAIGDSFIEEVRASLPELPETRKERFVSEYGLPAYDAELLTARRDVADYFEAAVRVHPNAKVLANWIIGDLFRIIKEKKLDEGLRITAWPVSAHRLGELVHLIDEGKISGKIAKTIFEEMIKTGASPDAIVREKGLEQVSDSGMIEKAVDEVLSAHSRQVADYRSGKDKVFGFLVGQVMKATQGKASPQMANEILRRKLAER